MIPSSASRDTDSSGSVRLGTTTADWLVLSINPGYIVPFDTDMMVDPSARLIAVLSDEMLERLDGEGTMLIEHPESTT